MLAEMIGKAAYEVLRTANVPITPKGAADGKVLALMGVCVGGTLGGNALNALAEEYMALSNRTKTESEVRSPQNDG